MPTYAHRQKYNQRAGYHGHRAVSIKIAGLKVLRREEKRTWQRGMYKTKGSGEAKMQKVIKAKGNWTEVGGSGKEKIETLTKRIQGALQEEVGQQKPWKNATTMQPKTTRSRN